MSSKWLNKIGDLDGSPFRLFQIMAHNDPVAFSRYPIAFLYILKSLIMFPFSLTEKLFLSGKIKKTEIRQTPVFVIGHYRSGTTYLHKTLASDKRWGCISTFDFLFPYAPKSIGKALKPFLQKTIHLFKIKHLHFHNYIFNLDDPLEEDMLTISAITPNSAFWSEIYPKNAWQHFNSQVFFTTVKEKEEWKKTYLYCLKKLTQKYPGKRLLLKNPPNTGRIKAVLELFPDAKFIFIYRNPYQVFYSTVSLWKRTLEKYYALHKITDAEREAIIFRHYNKLMQSYEEDKKLIPSENLVEVRYEIFEKYPFEEAKRIYTELGLADFANAAEDIKSRLDQEKSYTKYSYKYDEKTQNKILENWGHYINKWGYERLTSKKEPALQD